MSRLIVWFVFVVAALYGVPPTWAATRVQSSGVVVAQVVSTDPLVVALSLPAPPTVGHWLIYASFFPSWPSGFPPTLTTTDNATGGTNSYSQDGHFEAGVCSIYAGWIGVARVDRTNAGTFTTTMSLTNNGAGASWVGGVVTEYAVGTLVLDQTLPNDQSCSPPPPNVVDTTALGAAAQANEIAWAMAMIKGNYGGTVTNQATGTVPSSGWTEEVNTSGGANAPPPFSVESIIVTSSTAFRHQWDESTSTNAAWMTGITSYKYTDGGATQRMRMGVGP